MKKKHRRAMCKQNLEYMTMTPTDRPNQDPKECRHFGVGKCYAPMTIHLIGRCATCPLIYDPSLSCPHFTPKTEKDGK